MYEGQDAAQDMYLDSMILAWAADILQRRNPTAYFVEPTCHAAIKWVEYSARSLRLEAGYSE